MGNILNLDKVVPDDRYFVLNKKEFRVPGSFSVREALEISKIGQQAQEDPNKILEALKATWKVLKPYNKDKEDSDFVDHIKITMLSDLINFIFQNKQEEEEEKSKDGMYDNRGEESGR